MSGPGSIPPRPLLPGSRPSSDPFAELVVIRVQVLRLAGDAVGIQKLPFDSERVAQGQFGILAHPPPNDLAVLSNQPGLAVVLLAVEVRLRLPESCAEHLAQIREGTSTLKKGQPAPRANHQRPALDGRGDDHSGEPPGFAVCDIVDELGAAGPRGPPQIGHAQVSCYFSLVGGLDRDAGPLDRRFSAQVRPPRTTNAQVISPRNRSRPKLGPTQVV